jgi:pyruvate,orthophosphate dikinase
MTALTSEPILLLDGSTAAEKDLLGGKAWSIQRMVELGIPVPPAFVITTDVCRRYREGGMALPADAWDRVPAALAQLEAITGRTFGSTLRPLLVSVRSGAASSMPGMMDTVLNLGMTPGVERALAEETGDAAYAADTRRRFEEQFAKVVGTPPPADPWDQLRLAILAVLDSWGSRRATSYRESRGISHDGGTAVTIQAMVFGNLDERSGTGVLFTRNPLTGGPEPYGEWLPRGQGEDVVSGRADALPLAALEASMPKVHADLLAAARRLEEDSRDVQDIEFTVEQGVLWLLQARVAKRSPEAAVRHAVLLRREGLIEVREALDRIDPEHVQALLAPHLDGTALTDAVAIAHGKPASPGFATGVVVTDSDAAEDRADAGESVILARPTTDPDDVSAMSTAAAVITELGGSTSHAAVVCREMGVPCIVGIGVGAIEALAGQLVTVDATTGVVYAGEIQVAAASERGDADLASVSAWLRAELGPDVHGTLPELLAQRRAGSEGVR